jgi:hypothetical protein
MIVRDPYQSNISKTELAERERERQRQRETERERE